jgi:rSAM/selenodomain-associated transferase 1
MKAIVIMAREPEPHKVKTRLTPPLDPVTASKIYHGFLMDKIEQVEGIKEADHFVAYTPESSRYFFESIIPPDFTLLPQKGKDLGERLANICDTLFENGYVKIVMMDSDTPNLPSSYITDGLESLKKTDLVLGPCEDGGYYLIGLSSNMPQIFQGIPWSTSNVTEVTMRKAQALGKKIFLLEKWYDVDTISDLRRLKSELDAYPEVSNDVFFCKNTYKIVSEIF